MSTSRLSEIVDVRGQTLALVRELTQEQFDHRPEADRWSAGEIVEHLTISNRRYLGEIRKLIELKRAGRRPEIYVRLSEMDFRVPFVPRALLPLADIPLGVFNYFLPNRLREIFLSTPIVPVDTAPILRPRTGLDRESLIQGLEASLEETRRLIQDNSALDFSTFRYYHPIFGFNGVEDILGLLASHERRHHSQLKEAIAKAPQTGRANRDAGATAPSEPISPDLTL